MSQYQRMISYLYRYEKGVKGKNTGYVRIELQGQTCRLTLQLQDRLSTLPEVWIFRQMPHGIEKLTVGRLQQTNNGYRCRLETDAEDIFGTGQPFAKIDGLIVYLQASLFYGTTWNDVSIQLGNIKAFGEHLPTDEAKDDAAKPADDTDSNAINSTSNHTGNSTNSPADQNTGNSTNNPADQNTGNSTNNPADQNTGNSTNNLADQNTGNNTNNPADQNTGNSTNNLADQNTGSNTNNLSNNNTDSGRNNLTGNSTNSDTNETSELKEISLAIAEEPEETPEYGHLEPDLPDSNKIWQEASEQQTKQSDKFLSGQDTAEQQTWPNDNSSTAQNAQKNAWTQGQTIHLSMKQTSPETAGDPQEQSAARGCGQCRYCARQNGKQDDMGDHIMSLFPKMYPFELESMGECVRFDLKDIGCLPVRCWSLAGNPFLLHGYYCYRHIIFTKLQKGEYCIGVPGIYNRDNQEWASQCGMQQFQPLSDVAQLQGAFGYWLYPLKL